MITQKIKRDKILSSLHFKTYKYEAKTCFYNIHILNCFVK